MPDLEITELGWLVKIRAEAIVEVFVPADQALSDHEASHIAHRNADVVKFTKDGMHLRPEKYIQETLSIEKVEP